MGLDMEALKAHLGVESERIEGPDEVCKSMIRHFVEVMEDPNPLYHDEEYAKTTKYGEIISPPYMAFCWAQDPLWPEVNRKINSMEQVIKLLSDAGYAAIVATQQSQDYYAPIRLGQRISYTVQVTDISEQKNTARGVGYFTNNLYKFYQGDTHVCDQNFKLLIFKPGQSN